MKRTQILGWTIFTCLLTAMVISCSKKPTDFRSFLDNKEITYPGTISNPVALPGNGRLMLEWNPSTDPNVSKYVVYWNNYADSLVLPATTHNPSDTVKALISNLEEYNYTFFVTSYDNDGNKSVTGEINNARVYGNIYKSNLYNRPVNTDDPFYVSQDGNNVSLYFLTPDSINLNTVVKYTNTMGNPSVYNLSPNKDSFTLSDYKFGTPVVYQSSYIPVRGAIDTFYTTTYDTFPSIFKLVQCDKSLFKGMNLPNDMQPYDGNTQLYQLWDGATQPKEYPNIFHSNGAQPLPQHFSFDMGKVYNNLAKLQEIGRGSAHNPLDFEVWGIADTTNAITLLPGNDAGWKDEAISKGWTLLKEVLRTDNGVAPFNADLINNPSPVRFIMIRVLKTYDDPNYVNLSQLTFWDKE